MALVGYFCLFAEEELVQGVHARAGGNEHEAGDGDESNQFPAAIGNEDAGGEVVGKDASAHHLQGDEDYAQDDACCEHGE